MPPAKLERREKSLPILSIPVEARGTKGITKGKELLIRDGVRPNC